MLYLKDKIILDESYTSNEYLALLSILLLLRKDEKKYYCNLDTLSYLLTKDLPTENNFNKNLFDGFNGLVEKEIISIIKVLGKNGWIINTNGLTHEFEQNSSDFYTAFDENDISKILLAAKTYYTKAISMVRFYCYLLTTVTKTGDKEGVGFTSYNDMSYYASIHKNTIMRYIKDLEELQLIYVYRPDDYIIFENGDIAEIGNTYGRYEDKDKIYKVGSKYAASYGYKFTTRYKKLDKAVANKTRGLSQKHIHMIRCRDQGVSHEYTIDECKKIYVAMAELNERYIKEGRDCKMKDLTVFQGYDFYKK